MRKDGIYTEQGFIEGGRYPDREARFSFDKDVCAQINSRRKSCPSLEEALSKIPVWNNDEESLPLEAVEDSIWFMIHRCRFEFQCGFFNWMEIGNVWRDIEQFAAIDSAMGDRMIEFFNQTLDIWHMKPSQIVIVTPPPIATPKAVSLRTKLFQRFKSGIMRRRKYLMVQVNNRSDA